MYKNYVQKKIMYMQMFRVVLFIISKTVLQLVNI